MRIIGKIICLIIVLSLIAPYQIATTTTPISPLKEMNYYPRDYAWEQVWSAWDQAKPDMETDLTRMHELGVNTVRIFLHPTAFGYPQPEPAVLERFEQALALIDANDLQAHVTLFDCWWSWDDIAGSQQWVTSVVGPYRDDPRIAVWELQNEVALDQPNVRTWVKHLFPVLTVQAGHTPVTVSVGNVEWLDDVRELTTPTVPTLYSLHWYPNDTTWTAPFAAVLMRARQLIGDADLRLGEFGANTATFSEASQAHLYRDVLYTAHQQNLVHLGAWTLTDFPVGTQGCGNVALPLHERAYGLVRLDGTLKPAASLLQSAFQGDPPTSPAPVTILNGSFEDVNPVTGQIAQWRPWDQDWSGQVGIMQDCTLHYQGQCALKVTGVIGKQTGAYASPAFPVEEGRRYHLAGFVRTEHLEGWARLLLVWFNADFQMLGDTASMPVTTPTTASWEQLTIQDVTPPAQAAFFQLYVQRYAANDTAVVWFDDLTLVTPAPTITELTPATILAGHGALALDVVGTDFVTGAVVEWDGYPRYTTRISSTRLRADILASDVARAGTVSIRVVHPCAGDGVSAVHTFVINDPPITPSVTPTLATPTPVPGQCLAPTLIDTLLGVNNWRIMHVNGVLVDQLPDQGNGSFNVTVPIIQVDKDGASYRQGDHVPAGGLASVWFDRPIGPCDDTAAQQHIFLPLVTTMTNR